MSDTACRAAQAGRQQPRKAKYVRDAVGQQLSDGIGGNLWTEDEFDNRLQNQKCQDEVDEQLDPERERAAQSRH